MRSEHLLEVLITGIVGVVAWNFLIAPSLALGTISVFAALGFALVFSNVAALAGYAFGASFARRQLAAQEEYGEAAARYLAEVEELEAEEELSAEEERRRSIRGGQG